jgi:hypothetical protein
MECLQFVGHSLLSSSCAVEDMPSSASWSEAGEGDMTFKIQRSGFSLLSGCHDVSCLAPPHPPHYDGLTLLKLVSLCSPGCP